MVLASFWPSSRKRELIEDLRFLSHEPEEEYRAKSKEFLDGDQLGDFRQDAFLFHKRQRGLVPTRSCRSAELDRAIQVRILHGRDYYQRQYAFAGPVDPRDGKPFSEFSSEYRQWAAEQAKPILSVEHANLIEHVAFGYRAHDVAPSLLSEGIAHGIVRGRYCGVPCQTRLDWLNPKRGIVAVVVCDRFTCLDSHLRYSGPVDELAFHRALLAQHVGRHVPVHIIAVEKELPHRCSVWAVSERLLRRARKENEKALESLLECRRFNRWPTGYEGIRKLAPIGI